jgi:hypothetical protein
MNSFLNQLKVNIFYRISRVNFILCCFSGWFIFQSQPAGVKANKVLPVYLADSFASCTDGGC